jgi:hypothetical protein
MSPSKAFASIEEYNAFFNHANGRNQKEKLLKEADEAIAWGHADNECTGYTPGQFISVIIQLRNFIAKNVP